MKSSASVQLSPPNDEIRDAEEEFFGRLKDSRIPPGTKKEILWSHYLFSNLYVNEYGLSKTARRRSNEEPYFLHNTEMKLKMVKFGVPDPSLYRLTDAHDIIEIRRKYGFDAHQTISTLENHQVPDETIDCTILMTRPTKRDIDGTIIEDKDNKSYIDRATGNLSEPIFFPGRVLVPSHYQKQLLITKSADTENNIDETLLREGNPRSLSVKSYESWVLLDRLKRSYVPGGVNEEAYVETLKDNLSRKRRQLESRIKELKIGKS